MYAPLWSQGDGSAACNLLGAEHDVLRTHWAALKRPVEGEEAASLVRRGAESMLALLRHHFHNEEFFMCALAYPSLECHKADHKRLIRDFKDLLNGLSETSQRWPQVVLLLHEWHLEHGRNYDKQLQRYVNEHLSRNVSFVRNKDLG